MNENEKDYWLNNPLNACDRIAVDNTLHQDIMEFATSLGLFQCGQTVNAYNSFERIKNYVKEKENKID
jgi:hypothetical protein